MREFLLNLIKKAEARKAELEAKRSALVDESETLTFDEEDLEKSKAAVSRLSLIHI